MIDSDDLFGMIKIREPKRLPNNMELRPNNIVGVRYLKDSLECKSFIERVGKYINLNRDIFDVSEVHLNKFENKVFKKIAKFC